MSIIYKITNLTNGMVYIGRSNKTLEEAWTTHRREGRQKNPVRLIGQVIKEFGVENFAHEVIEECDADQLRARHKYWMEAYDSQTKGYNKQHSGGNLVDHSTVLEMYAEGKTSAEIAAKLHCDERTVVSHIKADKPEVTVTEITKRTGRPSSVPTILQLWADGMTHHEIATKLELSHQWVQTKLRQNGITIKELYERLGEPLPASYRKYEYAQVNDEEKPIEFTDKATVIADRHHIARTTLYDACTGPNTHARGNMFRRFDEDGVMVPRLYEPVGNTVPVTCANPDNPEMTQEFDSITAAVVALTGKKDMYVMQQLRLAASKHTVFHGMYWYIEERDTRRRPIYAFSVEDYEKQEVFMNQGEAARFLRLHQNQVSRHLNYPQKYRSAGGYILSWNENFSRAEWADAARHARPANGRNKTSQTQKQHIYLTNIDVYEVTYCSTLVDAIEKTESSFAVIKKCLRGEAKTAKKFFVTEEPLTYEEWEVRVNSKTIQSPTACRPVYGIHINTHEVITAKSIGDAAKKVGVDRTAISSALRHNHLSAGYRWNYGVPTNA